LNSKVHETSVHPRLQLYAKIFAGEISSKVASAALPLSNSTLSKRLRNTSIRALSQNKTLQGYGLDWVSWLWLVGWLGWLLN